MITTTIMRRVLAKLEAETIRTFVPRTARGDDPGARLRALRLLQDNDKLIARMVKALNAETHTLADFRNMPADAKPRALGAGARSTACDDQHTTAREL